MRKGGIILALAATIVETLSSAAVDVLWFPFLPVAGALGIPGNSPLEWLLICANSLLWGAVLYAAFRMLRRKTPSIDRDAMS